MAFVNELISDADKTRIDWSRFKWWQHSDPHLPWKWTIDRDRDAFLVPLVRPGRDDSNTTPEAFALACHGQIIRVDAFAIGSASGKSWDALIWRVVNVVIPPALSLPESDVLVLLADALKAYGYIFDTTDLKRIDVEFDASSAS